MICQTAKLHRVNNAAAAWPVLLLVSSRLHNGQTLTVRFVMDQLYNLLYHKSTAKPQQIERMEFEPYTTTRSHYAAPVLRTFLRECLLSFTFVKRRSRLATLASICRSSSLHKHFRLWSSSAPIREPSIVMSVSADLCVCLSVRGQEPRSASEFHHIFCACCL